MTVSCGYPVRQARPGPYLSVYKLISLDIATVVAIPRVAEYFYCVKWENCAIHKVMLSMSLPAF